MTSDQFTRDLLERIERRLARVDDKCDAMNSAHADLRVAVVQVDERSEGRHAVTVSALETMRVELQGYVAQCEATTATVTEWKRWQTFAVKLCIAIGAITGLIVSVSQVVQALK